MCLQESVVPADKRLPDKAMPRQPAFPRNLQNSEFFEIDSILIRSSSLAPPGFCECGARRGNRIGKSWTVFRGSRLETHPESPPATMGAPVSACRTADWKISKKLK